MMMQLYGNNALRGMNGQSVQSTGGATGYGQGPQQFLGQSANNMNSMQSIASGFVGAQQTQQAQAAQAAQQAQAAQMSATTGNGLGQYGGIQNTAAVTPNVGLYASNNASDPMTYASGAPQTFVGGATPSTTPANGVQGYSADQLAQARQNTPYAVNANLNAAFQGNYVQSAGNKSGGNSAVTSIANAGPSFGSYTKINPVNYRNMNADTKGRYQSLALANEGVTADDLAKQQKTVLPGSSIAYR